MKSSSKKWMALPLAAMLAVSVGCNETNNNSSEAAAKDSLVADGVAATTDKTAVANEAGADSLFSVAGTIGAITPGKDGYMADLKADNGNYTAVFSILKLGKNYKQLKTGDKLTVSGDTIHMGNTVNVQVKQFTLE